MLGNPSRTCGWLWAMLLLLSGAMARGQTAPIEFTQETLDNGLQVIYTPLHQAPVVHVRVLYHVGSRDERPDRQGFAHMFEHMMFRGSAHVPPEQHMKLIGTVGGYSNAFTSFDETVYVNTVPANFLEMALYLEADRMASFKVSPAIYRTERMVVAEEWRMRQNRPYGTMHDDFHNLAYQRHSYRWTPIGNMEHLQSAQAPELQEFFNTYYVPNNAVLVIAGDIDVPAAKQMVHRYFSWIPKGDPVERLSPAEPEQTAARRLAEKQPVPLPSLIIGYKIPAYRSDDHYPLSLLATILSGGRSGRLDVALVNNEKPKCTSVYAGHEQLEDSGYFAVGGMVMAGQDSAEVEAILQDQLKQVAEHGVTEAELNKAKTQTRIAIVRNRETAANLAGELGEAALFGGDANRVNTDWPKLQAVTSADIQRVAAKYLQPQRASTVVFLPGGEAQPAPVAAPGSQLLHPATQSSQPATQAVAQAVQPRPVQFPADYPSSPPMSKEVLRATFNKGIEKEMDGVRVIVMTDSRLPLVAWNLTMRRGSHLQPHGKEGLGWITAEMVRRGPEGTSFQKLNEYLESRGISLDVGDGGDYTRISGSSTSDQLEEGMAQTRKLLRSPAFSPVEFANVKKQLTDVLRQQQASASSVSNNELNAAVYGDSPLGRYATPQSLESISLDDVKAYFGRTYIPDQAVLMIAGDVTVEKGQELARKLLEEWRIPARLEQADYNLPPVPSQRRIILVDRPEGKQSTVQMAIRAYSITSDEKFPGSIASQILTAGIDSRLGKYVRAEKGLAYSVHGVFSPNRHGGTFSAGTDTAIDSTADAIAAMFQVFDAMRQKDVTNEELTDAKMRVTGGMVMSLQTIGQQASMRVEGILNGYPIDYYDKYPQRIAQVAAEQVRQVMNKYVNNDAMTVVIVAPAQRVLEQLRKLGEVQVVPMPAKRAPASQPAATQPVKDAA